MPKKLLIFIRDFLYATIFLVIIVIFLNGLFMITAIVLMGSDLGIK